MFTSIITQGSIMKYDGKLSVIGYLQESAMIDNPKQTLIDENFRPQSIQAAIIKRAFIKDYGIENVVGAVGQDSLFFQELMLNAKSAYYLDLPIHIYYAERSNSTVNKINVSFFEKSLLLEREQVKRFSNYGVLEDYKERRLEHFLKYWYIEKLKQVTPENKEKCFSLADEICQLYGKSAKEYLY